MYTATKKIYMAMKNIYMATKIYIRQRKIPSSQNEILLQIEPFLPDMVCYNSRLLRSTILVGLIKLSNSY